MSTKIEPGSRGAGEQRSRVYHVSRITHHASRIAVIALLLLATWLRLWRLNSIPPGLWFDESFNAMEAVWMLKTQSWPIFILGGQGREMLFHYLLALSIAALGETIYAVRLVPALLGILSIPLMYCWVLALFKGEPMARWLAIIGSAGLTLSLWYLIMNRVGYRANTFLPVLLLTGYFFWQGWQRKRLRYYITAGICLGITQYTYLAARLTPLIFIGFVAGQTVLNWPRRQGLKTAWMGVLLMIVTAGLVFTPMIIFFTYYPELFWERGGDVAFKVDWSGQWVSALLWQGLSAIRVFIDGQDPNWRHQLVGRPAFDILSILAFWLGLLVAIRQVRRPAYLFLLVNLGVMWLPALLAEPAFHALRLVGILPAYYALAAIGLLALAGWVKRRFMAGATAWQPGWMALLLVLLVSGGGNIYAYFYRWANLPQVYQAFDGPVVDLAEHLAALEPGANVIIPFYLYAHASLRYGLNRHFEEEVLMPADIKQEGKTRVILPTYPEDDGLPPALVWLVKDEQGQGAAYVSEVRRDEALKQRLTEFPITPIYGSRGDVIARQYEVDLADISFLFSQQLPAGKASVAWADNLRLIGYEFAPPLVEAGETANLHLAWQILGYTGLEERMFLQLLNSRGEPVGQSEVAPLSRKMYRWRDDGLILEQLPLALQADLPAGLYFARLGFFNDKTGQRLPASGPEGQPLGDELIVGPLYIKTHNDDPTTPQHPLQAQLGHEFELLGYSIYPLPAENATEIQLFWQSLAPVEVDYTVFVQVLDDQNRVVAQTDAQPLPNLYPTSRWQPGDIISERFVVPVGAAELPGRLVTGMYDLSTGARLPAYDAKNVLQPDGLVELLGP